MSEQEKPVGVEERRDIVDILNVGTPTAAEMRAGAEEIMRLRREKYALKIQLAEAQQPHKSGTNELIAKLYECRRMVGNMCSEGRPPKMSIPARPEVDEDLVICRTISEAIVALGGTVEPPGGRNNATAAPRGGERHEGEGIARVDGALAVETAAVQTDGEKPPCGSNFESKPRTNDIQHKADCPAAKERNAICMCGLKP